MFLYTSPFPYLEGNRSTFESQLTNYLLLNFKCDFMILQQILFKNIFLLIHGAENEAWLVTYRFERSHSKQICHHGRESGRKTALCDETKLKFREANDIVALLPIPRWNIQQVGFIVILHKLNNNTNIITIIFD